MHSRAITCCVGQALVDGVTAACYNVIFTSVPILIFAVLDRPVRHFATLMRYPQVWHPRNPLTLTHIRTCEKQKY